MTSSSVVSEKLSTGSTMVSWSWSSFSGHNSFVPEFNLASVLVEHFDECSWRRAGEENHDRQHLMSKSMASISSRKSCLPTLQLSFDRLWPMNRHMLSQLVREGEELVANSALVPNLTKHILMAFTWSSPHWQQFLNVDLPDGISGGSFEQTSSHSGDTHNDGQYHESRGVPSGSSSVWKLFHRPCREKALGYCALSCVIPAWFCRNKLYDIVCTFCFPTSRSLFQHALSSVPEQGKTCCKIHRGTSSVCALFDGLSNLADWRTWSHIGRIQSLSSCLIGAPSICVGLGGCLF